MKITGGTARGVALFEAHGLPIRPAQAIVRQALFNILVDVTEFNVLDLFSGTGSLGCEALSRGAARCVFVDWDRRCVDLIEKNVAKLRFDDRATVLSLDILKSIPSLVEQGLAFDLIFVAPPYDMFRDPSTSLQLSEWLSDLTSSTLLALDAVVIMERPVKGGFAADPAGLRVTDTRVYGQTGLTFYKKNQ